VRSSNLVKDGNGWETKARNTHFADKHLEVATEVVKTPTRPGGKSWTIVHRKAAVVIAPMTRDGKIVLIRQERVPIRAAIWEMPSGQIDNHDAGEKEMREVALSELSEEAGYQMANDGELIALGYFFSSPGFTDEHCHFFLARPVERSRDYQRDESELIVDCREFSAEEIRRMIAENEIRDANTLSICARLAVRGFISLDRAD
jgi:ADP-ribose pyrophosphatase